MGGWIELSFEPNLMQLENLIEFSFNWTLSACAEFELNCDCKNTVHIKVNIFTIRKTAVRVGKWCSKVHWTEH